MSLSSMLCIKEAYEMNVPQVIDCLVRSGLSVFDEQKRVRINTSNDDYEWESLPMTYDELKELILFKQTNGYNIGICFFEGKDPVTELLITYDPDTLIFGCDLNRKTFKYGEFEFTDFNWYMKKIVYPLVKDGLNLVDLEISEYR